MRVLAIWTLYLLAASAVGVAAVAVAAPAVSAVAVLTALPVMDVSASVARLGELYTPPSTMLALLTVPPAEVTTAAQLTSGKSMAFLKANFR